MKYLLILFIACSNLFSQTFEKFTHEPPMGWNSYDAYHGAITEKQFLQCVDSLSTKLLPFGWEYAVIDFCWYHPGVKGWSPDNWKTFKLKQLKDKNNNLYPSLTIDQYGRLLPAPNRFPTSKNNNGFKKIADYVHSKGMKFGIHIMRGAPREAVSKKLKVYGTNIFIEDIVNKNDTCFWNNHMYGVDISKKGAQEYYNSLFNLYASWEVDFIKADDMMVPAYHKGEIEMMRKAIDQCGREIVLSLSCGESIISDAFHLKENANTWRISIDFWDEWKDLERMFTLTEAWSPFIGNGTWPDADMIPIGKLCLSGYPKAREKNDPKKLEHFSRFTKDEKITLLNLWSIFKSPLIWGGDPITTSDNDYALLQNRDIIYVNQKSKNNKLVYHGYGPNDLRIWIADDSINDDKFIAIFNLSDAKKNCEFLFLYAQLNGTYEFTDLWSKQNKGLYTDKFSVDIPPHGSKLYRLKKIK